MKKNADYREFTTLEQIVDDMIITIDAWLPDKQKDAIDFSLGYYINDWYKEYELSKDEESEIESMVWTWLTSEPEWEN